MAFMSTPMSRTPYFFGQVEGRLSPHGGEDGVYFIFIQDLFDAFYCQGQQIDLVCHHGVGHDRSGVAVDQDDLDSIFPQAAGGLGAGIVEFTSLADDYGTGTDDKYAADRRVFGHDGKNIKLREVTAVGGNFPTFFRMWESGRRRESG
jgi:hypothetical protein